jgi:toxin YoeB
VSRHAVRQVTRLAVFQPDFPEDLRYWVETDRRTVRRLLDLVEAPLRDPFTGMGKPEPLKYLGSDVWSRRITQEHRRVAFFAKRARLPKVDGLANPAGGLAYRHSFFTPATWVGGRGTHQAPLPG